MGTKQPINYYFENFNIYNEESCIYQEMHYCRNRAYEHFSLTEGNPQHCFPPFRFSIRAVKRKAEFYITPDLADIPGKKRNSDYNYNQEDYLRDHEDSFCAKNSY